MTSPVDPDVVVGIDGDEDVGLGLLHCSGGLRAVDVDAGLLDEGGGNDEEDQHDEHHVEHRCDVDAGFLFLVLNVGKYLSHESDSGFIC